ncbi:MAG TPA: class I SAM-dependent methyltransferase [Reyranella sp.]|jgi:SAM-dependent methyltransferase|nr:class I SAM-dependent methyltransferase [Reyranella sp.]
MDTLRSVHARIEAYYADKISRHGASPRGVDWTCTATQQLRFVQLLKLCDFSQPFSLNDVGCGYGALVGFLAWRHPEAEVDYLGVDLSPAMISRARRRHRGTPGRRFVVGNDSPRVADYAVASGVMNVMLDHPRDLWEEFVADTLRRMHASSRRGFAVNFMAERRDGTATEGLYRADPARWTSFCQQTLGCAVEVVGGYGMREFTLLVRLDHEP